MFPQRALIQEGKKENIFLFIKNQTKTGPTSPSARADRTACRRKAAPALRAGPDLTGLHQEKEGGQTKQKPCSYSEASPLPAACTHESQHSQDSQGEIRSAYGNKLTQLRVHSSLAAPRFHQGWPSLVPLSLCAPASPWNLCSKGPWAAPEGHRNKVPAMSWPSAAGHSVQRALRCLLLLDQRLRCWAAHLRAHQGVSSTNLRVSAELQRKSHTTLSCLDVQWAPLLMRAATASPGAPGEPASWCCGFGTWASRCYLHGLLCAGTRRVLSLLAGSAQRSCQRSYLWVCAWLTSPSRARVWTLTVVPSAPAALMLSTEMLKQAEILFDKLGSLLYLLYLLSLPYSPSLAQLKSFQQLGL